MRKIAIAVSTSLILLGHLPAQAMENGSSALGHPRIISLILDNHGGCTGWLYSSRIVFTNAHCVHVWEKRPEKVLIDIKRLSVSAPGSAYDFSARSKRIAVEKIFQSTTFDWFRAEVGGTLSYTDDFAVLVLKEEFPNVKTASLVSKEQVTDLIRNRSMVWTGGYGLQSADDRKKEMQGISREGLEPKKAAYSIISNDEGMSKVNEFRQKWSRNFFQEITVFVKVPVNGPAPCDGDSGSGFFLEDAGKFTYLGVTHVNLGNPNCGLETPTTDGITGFAPVYLFSDYVKAAEDYVAANPIKQPALSTITCKRGKKIQIVAKFVGQCPKGYKKTA